MEPIIDQLKAAQQELQAGIEILAKTNSRAITKVAVAHFRVRQAIEDLERVNKVVSAL